MNKIFQIGFNKCGTLSIHKLFNENCYPIQKSIHWNHGYLAKDIYENIINGNDPLIGYESFVSFCDMESFILIDNKIKWVSIGKDYFDILDRYYPDSKFILNTRNIDNWISSRINHLCTMSPIINNVTIPLNQSIPYVEYQKIAYSIENTNDIINIWKQEWISHHDNVLKYFSSRPEDLLVFDIEQDSFSKFKNFFGQYGFNFNINTLPHEHKTI